MAEAEMPPELPAGYRASGVHCGLKTVGRHPDLALIVSDPPAAAAGVYTQNRVCAAPIELNRQRTPAEAVRAVVINSGNANACTGQEGWENANSMARLAAGVCHCDPTQVLVLSTGVIGHPLDMRKVASGISAAGAGLGADADSLRAAARAIMTTDTVDKIAMRAVELEGCRYRVTGLAKGSGMIAPNLATMLSVIMTDVRLSADQAQQGLADVARRTFNAISVDGHESTNDAVLLLANGAASGQTLPPSALPRFWQACEEVCSQLALAIVDDGEGASHVVEIVVRGCRRTEDAERIARTVAASPLVKTAIAGADPNWGRIISAAGYAGPEFDPNGVSLRLHGTLLYQAGAPVDFDRKGLAQAMRDHRQLVLELTFAEGTAEARLWTCDLTAEYVRINADYHT